MSESENITVGIRIRPLNERELSQGGQIEWFSESSTCLLEKPLDGSHESRSVFDRIYSSETDTVEVYHCQGQPVIDKFMKGFNGCIFCYGQTGSGKTHTMYGDRKKNLGLVPISVDQIFAHIEESKNIDYLLRCSYVEIYNESVNDLLDPSKLNLTIVEDKRNGIKIKDVTENICSSFNQVAALIQIGEKHKNVASTNFNQRSSRSHSVLVVEIKQNLGPVLTSTLNLIDLAGSESANVHGDDPSASRTKETKCINRSLLTLSTVIMRLSDKKNKTPVPFRDSKLTRILQPALEGNSKVSIICNISSFIGSHAETSSTVNFAKRAKKIKQIVVQNELKDSNSLITKYQQEIIDLQHRLREMENKLDGQVNVTTKIEYTENILDLIEKKEKAEQEVDEILQEKLKLEKELKMMRSFILNSEDIKPGKRLLNPEVLKKEVMKGLMNKISGLPISNKLNDPDRVLIRRESLLTEGIDDILDILEKFDEKETKDSSTGVNLVNKETNSLLSSLFSLKKPENPEEKPQKLPESENLAKEKIEIENPEKSEDKAKIADQAKMIQELTEALKCQDSIIKKMTEIIEEKTSEITILKEEVKLHKQTSIHSSIISRFIKKDHPPKEEMNK